MDHLDFEGFDETDFEQFCFELLTGLDGFHNVDWRKGTPKPTSPADRGRDIVAEVDHFEPDGARLVETWFVDCKHYRRGVPPEALQGLLSWAQAERPHVALVMASGFLSNGAKDFLKDFERNNRPPFRIKYWERPTLARLRSEAARPRPHLVFVGTEAAMAATITGPAIPMVTAGTASWSTISPAASGVAGPGTALPINHYVRVRVANDPGERVGECAGAVTATIAFLDDGGRQLIPEMIGRWAETRQRVETGRLGLTMEESEIDIEANGRPNPLDIAMKAPTDTHFYAFNHENSQARDLRLDAHRIDIARCRVCVTVRAGNSVPIGRTFLLRNAGVGGG